MAATKPHSVRMEDELWQKLSELAAKRHTTPSGLLRELATIVTRPKKQETKP
jgi:predicted transcriptional regulator